jgi:hypothetical protein
MPACAGMGVYRNNIVLMSTAASNANGADAANNSWDISGLTVAASDFESVDTAGVFGPRKPDGSLPDIRFLRLSGGSPLIDKGKDVGIPFQGAAPDLGAFERGSPTAARAPRYPGRHPLVPGLVNAAGRRLHRSGAASPPGAIATSGSR